MSQEQNLRSRTQRADYIVVYYDGFAAAAADSLAAWRRASLPLTGVEGPYATRTVPVSALYDQFSGGRTDPSAIRNFLRAAYYNWNDGGTPRRPSFVTLLGDASYDFKNLKGLAARRAARLPGAHLRGQLRRHLHRAAPVRHRRLAAERGQRLHRRAHPGPAGRAAPGGRRGHRARRGARQGAGPRARPASWASGATASCSSPTTTTRARRCRPAGAGLPPAADGGAGRGEPAAAHGPRLRLSAHLPDGAQLQQARRQGGHQAGHGGRAWRW